MSRAGRSCWGAQTSDRLIAGTPPRSRPRPPAAVSQSTGLRRLLDDEPALTIRVLTDPRGQVQTGIVAFVEELLRREIEEFGLVRRWP